MHCITPDKHYLPDGVDLQACGLGNNHIWALAAPPLKMREESDSAVSDGRRREDLREGWCRSADMYPRSAITKKGPPRDIRKNSSFE